jgi:poly-beta-1,6-N-acetyl-D-glucosamine synthase
MIFVDMILAMGRDELMAFFWLSLLMDVPRYFISALVLAVIRPGGRGSASHDRTVSAVISCYNEAHSIKACVDSLKANGVGQIIVVNDGSTDLTHDAALATGALVIDLPERIGKALAINVALPQCTGDAVLICDADTVFDPGSIAVALSYLEPGVGGVCFNLGVRNVAATLTTRYQAIEYFLIFTVGKTMADVFDILPNVSGAAGLYSRAAVNEVGGLDCEVAEDAALSMKLRVQGWNLRYSYDAHAATMVPETPADLFLQRLRWDASIVTIYWRKFGFLLDPFSNRFTPRNLFTSLDVLVFSMFMPMILPIYVAWVWSRVGADDLLILFAAVLTVLFAMEFISLILLQTPIRYLPYVPYYLLTQTLVMRPFRVFALIAELTFRVTHYDDYVPRSQRWRLT